LPRLRSGRRNRGRCHGGSRTTWPTGLRVDAFDEQAGDDFGDRDDHEQFDELQALDRDDGEKAEGKHQGDRPPRDDAEEDANHADQDHQGG
jgi:hypothetical protein